MPRLARGFWVTLGVLLVAVCLFPTIDLVVSGWFYHTGEGFFLAEHPFLKAVHYTAVRGGWVLPAVFIACLVMTLVTRRAFCGVTTRGWLFLLLTLAVGLGLIANIGLKDHWGRARPRAVVVFGGDRPFTPAWQPQSKAHSNDSFVAGDGAFGFFLPAIAFLLPVASTAQQRRSRQTFYGLLGIGSLFGLARIMMGAHFLSDVLFALLVMLSAAAAFHALLFGFSATSQRLRLWLFLNNPSENLG